MKVLFLLIGSIILFVCCTGKSSSLLQSSPQRPVNLSPRPSSSPEQPVDLAQIPHLQPKGRVQDKDYNNIEMIDRLVAMQVHAIPFLIDKLTDETKIKHPVADFWQQVTVGDVAFIILTDFFTDSSWTKTTIPGVGWDEMLERKDQAETGEQTLRRFIVRHGRKVIKERWAKVWNENRDKLYWDKKERCFKLK